MNTNPDCYRCIHRGSVPGSAHSSCNHPSTIGKIRLPLTARMFSYGVLRIYHPRHGGNNILEVKGKAHGIVNGWFTWPIDFDPIWLESCNGLSTQVDVVIPPRFLDVN